MQHYTASILPRTGSRIVQEAERITPPMVGFFLLIVFLYCVRASDPPRAEGSLVRLSASDGSPRGGAKVSGSYSEMCDCFFCCEQDKEQHQYSLPHQCQLIRDARVSAYFNLL